MIRQSAIVASILLGVLATSTPKAQQMEHFRVQKINDHVYAYLGWDPTIDLVNGNSYAILTDDGVFVVDAHHLPVIADANIAHIKTMTDKPVTAVLNTHWHGDHNTGNSAYVKVFPHVQIIAQSKTREILSRRQPEWIGKFKEGEWDGYITYFGKLLTDGKTSSGRELKPVEISRMQRLMDVLRKYAPHSRDVQVTLPNVTFDDEMTLFMGGREIQIRHTGNANTPGDAWVWLPQDSILITGDILVSPIPYCFGSSHDDWIKTLDVMLSLKPKWILPGHGEPMRDTAYLRQVRDVLAEIVQQTKRGYDLGIRDADSLKASLDLTANRKAMCGDDPERHYIFDYFMVDPSVARLLKVFDIKIGDDLEEN